MISYLRADFPLLNRHIDNTPVNYMDSAAATLKPKRVLDSEIHYATEYASNIHRGKNSLSNEASYAYESARHTIAQWIKADLDLVVMMPNTSYALATIAFGLELTKNDYVLCVRNNHHSNLIPWIRHAKVVYVDQDPLEPIDLDAVIHAIKKYKPKLFSFTWVSNVNGVISSAEMLCKIAKEYNVISLVDAAQAAAHVPIDVSQINCDFLVFSGHKILGPNGTGVLYGRREFLEKFEPLVIGGGSVNHVSFNQFTLKEAPYKFEAGTQNISGVIGLGEAIKYLTEIGFKKIIEHENTLKQAMLEAFKDIKNAKILTTKNPKDSISLISVIPTINMHSDILCQILSDSYKIMTRSGFHCVHPLFSYLNIINGAVRFSPYIYNTVEEICSAGKALKKILG